MHSKPSSRRPGRYPGRLSACWALALLAGLLLACGADDEQGLRLVFYSDRDGDDEIYVMKEDGTGVTARTLTCS